MHSTFFVPFYQFHGSLWEDQKDKMGPRSPKRQDVPRYAPSRRIQVEADERVAQLERQLAQKEIAFAALEQESLPKWQEWQPTFFLMFVLSQEESQWSMVLCEQVCHANFWGPNLASIASNERTLDVAWRSEHDAFPPAKEKRSLRSEVRSLQNQVQDRSRFYAMDCRFVFVPELRGSLLCLFCDPALHDE